jgi:uncharacterized protein (DUF488 family)
MKATPPAAPARVYTIGHSNHPWEKFLELLEMHRLEAVVDVRSQPYSRYATHFDSAGLKNSLTAAGIGYVFMGDRLGGKPAGQEYYDDQGYVLYDRLAASPRFQEGIELLLDGLTGRRTALLCSEEDPAECHRRLLVGRVLAERGVEVIHLRGDGRVQSERELRAEEEFNRTKGQMSLFDLAQEQEWKSTRSVSPKKAHPNSSGPSDDME